MIPLHRLSLGLLSRASSPASAALVGPRGPGALLQAVASSAPRALPGLAARLQSNAASVSQTSRPSSFFSDISAAAEEKPLPSGAHPAVSSVVQNIMKCGEKAKYEKLVAESLRLIQLKTNQDPVELLSRALDMCAPLVKLLSAKRGSRRIQIPRPLTERARRRYAVLWIKQAADKKKGSFPVRFANEIMLVLKGTSGALEKRTFTHKLALQNRSNVR